MNIQFPKIYNRVIEEALQDLAVSESHFLGPVKRFALEDFINTPSEYSATSELELLIKAKRYESAYDLYLTDCFDAVPADYEEFLAKYVHETI